MKPETILQALSETRPALLDEARETAAPKTRKLRTLRRIALAAAVALCLASNGKVSDLASGVLRIGAPALLAWALMNLIAGRVDGLGYIYFSNADVAKDVQTAANMASAQSAIWSMGLLGAAVLIAVVAAFFSLRKKNA